MPVGSDVAATAKAFLAAENLPFGVQQGFYVSVFPTGFDAGSETDVEDGAGSGAAHDGAANQGQKVANPPSNLDSSPNDTPYDN